MVPANQSVLYSSFVGCRNYSKTLERNADMAHIFYLDPIYYDLHCKIALQWLLVEIGVNGCPNKYLNQPIATKVFQV